MNALLDGVGLGDRLKLAKEGVGGEAVGAFDGEELGVLVLEFGGSNVADGVWLGELKEGDIHAVVDGVLSEMTEGLGLGEDVVDVLLGGVGVEGVGVRTVSRSDGIWLGDTLAALGEVVVEGITLGSGIWLDVLLIEGVADVVMEGVLLGVSEEVWLGARSTLDGVME